MPPPLPRPLYFFYRMGCPYCEAMWERVLEPLKYEGIIQPILVDVDRQRGSMYWWWKDFCERAFKKEIVPMVMIPREGYAGGAYCDVFVTVKEVKWEEYFRQLERMRMRMAVVVRNPPPTPERLFVPR